MSSSWPSLTPSSTFSFSVPITAGAEGIGFPVPGSVSKTRGRGVVRARSVCFNMPAKAPWWDPCNTLRSWIDSTWQRLWHNWPFFLLRKYRRPAANESYTEIWTTFRNSETGSTAIESRQDKSNQASDQVIIHHTQKNPWNDHLGTWSRRGQF